MGEDGGEMEGDRDRGVLKLVESMPEHIEAVYQAKGGWTRY